MIGENDPIGSEKVADVREALSYCAYIGRVGTTGI